MNGGTGLLAVDLGGSRLRVAIFSKDAEMLFKAAFPTEDDDPGQLPRVLHEALRQTEIPIKGAVVGAPGPVSYGDGRVLLMPNLPLWRDALSRESLSDSLNLPVILANDADLAALGEHRFGAGIGVDDMVYVTSSTGVGCGVIIGGRLLHGNTSLAESGHMVIDRRSHETLEELGSGTALERLTGEPGERTTTAAHRGDRAALAKVAEVATALAIGVHNLVHCFMPQRVVIGGGFGLGAANLVLEPIRLELAACNRGCLVRGDDVRLALAGDDVGLYGAFALGRDSFG